MSYVDCSRFYATQPVEYLQREVDVLETRLAKLRTAIEKASLCPGSETELTILETNYNDNKLYLMAARNSLLSKMGPVATLSEEALTQRMQAAAMLDSEQDFVISGR